VVQVATPNMSGNARFFFTGNFPKLAPDGLGLPSETDPLNYFGKFGFPSSAGLTFTGTGATVSTAGPYQPIHLVTRSIWVPNNADLHFNFPNAYSTPAGGSGYTDIPFTGIRGFVDPVVSYAGGHLVTDQNLWGRPSAVVTLGVGHTAGTSLTVFGADANCNPANLRTDVGDRTFLLWMKKDLSPGTDPNAYATWAGSMLVGGGAAVDARGGITTAPSFNMTGAGLTDTQAQISWAEQGGQLGARTPALNSNTSITASWNRSQFELLRNIIGAPAQFGLGSRVKMVDPRLDIAQPQFPTGLVFDAPAVNTYDALPQNSLVVYGIKDRGTKTTQNGATYSSLLGEAGLEPGAPVIAQWWNTGNGDVNVSGFPAVMQAYNTTWLPADYTEVVAIEHNFVAKIQHPTTPDANPIDWKLYAQIGVIAPRGHILLADGTNGVRPVVTPVRQLQINDLRLNFADGNPAGNRGTALDIFNGNARNMATGAPAPGAPNYKLFDGNGTGFGDFTINGFSSVQITWQPAVNDLRHPSGYVVEIFKVLFPGFVQGVREIRMGHVGGIGAKQVMQLQPFAYIDLSGPRNPGDGTFPYFIRVRNVWMEGTEGAAGHSFDMGKEPFATRFPMAYADVVSGVFIVRY
jgi:hypothetical protein